MAGAAGCNPGDVIDCHFDCLHAVGTLNRFGVQIRQGSGSDSKDTVVVDLSPLRTAEDADMREAAKSAASEMGCIQVGGRALLSCQQDAFHSPADNS